MILLPLRKVFILILTKIKRYGRLTRASYSSCGGFWSLAKSLWAKQNTGSKYKKKYKIKKLHIYIYLYDTIYLLLSRNSNSITSIDI